MARCWIGGPLWRASSFLGALLLVRTLAVPGLACLARLARLARVLGRRPGVGVQWPGVVGRPPGPTALRCSAEGGRGSTRYAPLRCAALKQSPQVSPQSALTRAPPSPCAPHRRRQTTAPPPPTTTPAQEPPRLAPKCSTNCQGACKSPAIRLRIAFRSLADRKRIACESTAKSLLTSNLQPANRRASMQSAPDVIRRLRGLTSTRLPVRWSVGPSVRRSVGPTFDQPAGTSAHRHIGTSAYRHIGPSKSWAESGWGR